MKRLVSITAIAVGLAAPLNAQDVIELDEIIVSGGFTPVPAARYGRAVSVLTEVEIEERGITTVQDALRAVPGVAVSSNGSNFTEVRIRGGEASHTLILIDGIQAAGGSGGYVLSGLETANIERIEVLRGPQSVFYGASASAGVINIVTRRGGPGLEYGGSIEVGGGTSATGFVSQRGERGGISLSLSHNDDDGYDFSGDGGEKDGTRRSTAILSGDIMATDALRLGFTLRRSDEEYDFDSTSFAATDADSYVVDDPNQTSTRDETTAGIFAEYEMMGGRMTHRLSYERTDNEQTFNGGAPTETETEAVKYRLSYGLDGLAVADANHLITVFAEHETDASSTNPAYRREASSVALEYRGSLANGLDLQAGVRYDDNTQFKDAATWNLGLSYRFANQMRLHASAGTGIVDPSYFELFANSFGYTGNPDLQPERNRSFDIGLEIPVFAGRGVVDITYFNETLTDEITDVSTGPGTFSFENQAGDSDRQGLEISGQLQATDDLALRMGYTYVDATNPDGSTEARRPQHELTLGATLQTFGGRGSVSADLRHVAGNFDTQFWGAFELAELPDYTTVDVAARYGLTDRVTLTGRVVNLFEEDVSDTWGYAGRDRTLYVGLDARF